MPKITSNPTLEIKKQIRNYLYSNTPDNFKADEYYKYLDNDSQSYFDSGGFDTSLAIFLYLENNNKPDKNNKIRPTQLRSFLEKKLNLK